MEANHEPTPPPSAEHYRELYQGFTLSLQFREIGPDMECRAIAVGPVTWETPWGRSWITKLEQIRQLVGDYNRALAFCALNKARRFQSLAIGAIELVPTHPAVRS